MESFSVAELLNYGVAVVVALYVLMRIEPALKEQTKAVTLLTIVVAKISGQDLDQIKKDFQNGRDI